jgi:ribonuclease VapC
VIVDTSALVAILKREAEADVFLERLLTEPSVRLSAVTYFEFAMVVDGWRDRAASQAVDLLLDRVEAEIVPVGVETARRARRAHAGFGKGNHPARLNFGDCFAYALAMELDEALLFKGDDFARTDVRPAVAPLK